MLACHNLNRETLAGTSFRIARNSSEFQLKASAVPDCAIAASEKILLLNINLLINSYFDDFLCGSKTGIPSCIGYLSPHLEQISPFLSLVYSKSALHKGQARMLNKSFGMGSSTIFCLIFAILPDLKPKPLYTTSYYFFINFVKVIDTEC